jgi:hypothetical protein
MEGLLLFMAAEVAVVSIQIQKRQQLIRKWLRGELTLEELKDLKRRPWFRRAWKPKVVDFEKKTN